MERNDLLANIQWTKEVVMELEGAVEKHKGIKSHQHLLLNYKPLEDFYNPFMFRFYFVPILFITLTLYVFGDPLASLYYILNPSETVSLGILVALILFLIVPLVIYFTLLRILSRYLIKKSEVERMEEVRKCQSSIDMFQDNIQELNELITERTILPHAYRNSYCLIKFEDYFLKHRADSLKECINLFEQDEANERQRHEANIRHQEQLQVMEKQNKEMVRAVNKVKDQVEKSRTDYFRH
ncbi:hypothetical protein B14911_03469 [Bacillus sp. NRRL B-14911]|uniref:Uncharacterized protein n=1 Tax=Bacillus infantis NRRL B-14911 TaxID=1367477 RepID=U5LIK4_9BACI|nr:MULTISPECIES: hypothetical protein [Bacillus]AGX06462.1 hypothetical protein N288_23115 [Bacillus infantis NRRL B-14911]EAR68610.1 hypothetical protein B14911_03469 [Bacillus sp. NRRL B-14911]